MSETLPRELVFDNQMQQIDSKPPKRKSEFQKAEEQLAQQYGVCAPHKRQKKKCLCNVPEEEVALLRGPQLPVTNDGADRADEHPPGGGLPKSTSQGSSTPQSGFPDIAGQFQTNAVLAASSVSSETTSVVDPPRLFRLDSSLYFSVSRATSYHEVLEKYQEYRKEVLSKALCRLGRAFSFCFRALVAAVTKNGMPPTRFLMQVLENVDTEMYNGCWGTKDEFEERWVRLAFSVGFSDDFYWLLDLEERLKVESWAWRDCRLMYDIETANFLAVATRIKQSATAGPPERDKDQPSKYCTDLLAQSGFQSEIWKFYNISLTHELQSLSWRISLYEVAVRFDEMVSKMRAHLQTAAHHIKAGTTCDTDLSSEAKAHTAALLRQIRGPVPNAAPEEGTCSDPMPSSFTMRNLMLLQTAVG